MVFYTSTRALRHPGTIFEEDQFFLFFCIKDSFSHIVHFMLNLHQKELETYAIKHHIISMFQIGCTQLLKEMRICV